jgi:hypothetical protein
VDAALRSKTDGFKPQLQCLDRGHAADKLLGMEEFVALLDSPSLDSPAGEDNSFGDPFRGDVPSSRCWHLIPPAG